MFKSDILAATNGKIYLILRAALFLSFIGAAYFLFNIPSAAARKDVSASPALADPLLTVRSLAFLLVLFGHWFAAVNHPENVTEIIRSGSPFWLLTASPWCGVWIFFTLSGYLMGKGFVFGRYDASRSGISRFYRNRILRIVPMYFAAVLIVGTAVAPEMFNIFQPGAFLNVASVLTFDNEGLPPIGALWSVGTEVQFYLLVPFLFLILQPLMHRKRSIVALLFVITLTSVIYKYAVLRALGIDYWHQFVYVPLLANLDLFILGFSTAFLQKRLRESNFQLKHGIAIGLCACAMVWLILSWWSAHGMLTGGGAKRVFKSFAPVMTGFMTALIILIFENSRRNGAPNWAARLGWKLSTTLGTMTYALYVWHEPIMLAVKRLSPGPMPIITSIAYFAFAVAILFPVSYLAYRHIELPFDRMKRAVK